jgi:hypothetical protein
LFTSVFVGSYYLRHERPGPSSAAEMPRGIEGPLLAAELLRMDSESMLDMIFRVWLEMMWYAADHCSRDSHARQLNNGGEFLTVVWLLIEHVRLSPRERETADG